MARKILITGGAGFIGYHLSKRLVSDEENTIVLVDNLQRGVMDDELQSLIEHERVSFIEADVARKETYDALDTDFDHVYHLAAINGTKNFYDMPQEVLRINTLSLIYVLEWARNLKHKPKVCFTSSNEAYAGGLAAFGQLPLPTPEAVPLVIEDTYNPRWSYAATKAIGELFVIYYSKMYNFPAVIVRPHNFYGPRAGFGHVIPQMSERIIQQQDPFVVYGADETRSFCYIDDAVEAMHMLMDSEKTNEVPALTFHIGSDVEVTMANLAKELCSVAGYAPSQFNEQAGLAGSVKRRLPDISKIKEAVGWTPQTSLNEGLRKTFEWYQSRLQS